MADVCLYLQMHQPYRIRRVGVMDRGGDHYGDNRAILERVADRSYRPTLDLLTDLVRETNGAFRFSLGITGTLLRQLVSWAPDVVDRLHTLMATGCVEVVSETDAHSLAFLFDAAEMEAQVSAHGERLSALLGVCPTVFRNTEMVYGDAIGQFVLDQGYKACLVGGAESQLGGRRPHHVYESPGGLPLLLKSDRLSDDLAFRFGDRSWDEYPLVADRYADWLTTASGDYVGLFMDFETFGEHHDASTGILHFLERLPHALLARGGRFLTPTEVVDRFSPQDEFEVPGYISWADQERDLSAWLGNAMQRDATEAVYSLVAACRDAAESPGVAEAIRDMTTSDHVYYMCTKHHSDGEVHSYFSPFETPYDAYVAFMNTLRVLRRRLRPPAKPTAPEAVA